MKSQFLQLFLLLTLGLLVRSGTVDVKSYGAKGDGITDDSAALNRIGTAGGNHIVFSSGTYLVNAPVIFNGLRNQIISATGGATLKASSSFNKGTQETVLGIYNSINVTLDGLIVNGNRNPAQDHTVFIDNIRFSSGSLHTVKNVQSLEARTHGITGLNTNDFTVQDSVVQVVRAHGIWVEKCDRVKILRNRVTGALGSNQQSSIGILGTGRGASDILIESNSVLNFGDTGTKTEGYNNPIYRNNVVDSFGKDGIRIMSDPSRGIMNVKNALVEDNTVKNFRGYLSDGSSHFLVQGVDGAIVRRNKGYGTGGATTNTPYEDGIRVNENGTPSTRVVVEDNEFYEMRVGMRLQSANLVARRNIAKSTFNNADFAALVDQPNIVIEGGSLQTNSGIMVLLDNMGTASNLTIRGVTFQTASTSNTGIYAQNGNNIKNTFANNAFHTVRYPIKMGAGNTCYGNTGQYVDNVCAQPGLTSGSTTSTTGSGSTTGSTTSTTGSGSTTGSSTGSVCTSADEFFYLEMSCPSGLPISVSSAFYGTPSSCPSPVAGSCNSPNALSAVKSQCDGKNSCRFQVLNSLFGGDPCVNVPKHLKATYSCGGTTGGGTTTGGTGPASVCATANEFYPITMTCTGKTISVTSAFYGTPSPCPSPVAGSCNSPNALTAVKNQCNGKSSCNFQVLNSLFGGDPCVNVPKHLAATYVCV